VDPSRQSGIQTLRQTLSDDELARNLLELHIRLKCLHHLMSKFSETEHHVRFCPPSKVVSETQCNPPIHAHYRRSLDTSLLAECTFCILDPTRKPAARQLQSQLIIRAQETEVIDEPRSLVRADIHAEPFLIAVPAPWACVTNGLFDAMTANVARRPTKEMSWRQETS
jgi:hypothetical protein